VKSWAVPAAIVVAIEYLFALAIGVRVGFHYRIPIETYLVLGLTFAGLGVALIIVAKLAMYALQHEATPTRRLIRERPYLASFAVGVLLSALQISVLTWTKVMLPIASPFWADTWLANLDHALFGTDPWILASRFFGWTAPLIDRAYVTWAPLKFGTFLFVICMPESRKKSCALVSYFVMMAVVAIGQYLLSSAGPVFYARLGFGSRFASMPVEPWVASARDYLWHDYLNAGGALGGGISAMPSLHVAAALWMALVWRSYQRFAGLIAAAYFGLIAIGSVLLGWHYAVDALAGVVITLAAWVLAARLTARKFGPPNVRFVPAAAMSNR
jgi:hypothetical protein